MLLEKFAQKKKNPDINQCGEKGGGVGGVGITYPLEKGGKKKKKKKKKLVLTLGSPPEKGEKKKTLVLTLGSLPEKGKKKTKKILVLTLGSAI
jgi:hypothetical protein